MQNLSGELLNHVVKDDENDDGADDLMQTELAGSNGDAAPCK